MKVSEVNFGTYDYIRIAVLRHSGPEYCAAGAEDYVKRTYGERELAEDGVTNADGWLTLKLAETVKKEEKQ
jgi:hypothetical protein